MLPALSPGMSRIYSAFKPDMTGLLSAAGLFSLLYRKGIFLVKRFLSVSRIFPRQGRPAEPLCGGFSGFFTVRVKYYLTYLLHLAIILKYSHQTQRRGSAEI